MAIREFIFTNLFWGMISGKKAPIAGGNKEPKEARIKARIPIINTILISMNKRIGIIATTIAWEKFEININLIRLCRSANTPAKIPKIIAGK